MCSRATSGSPERHPHFDHDTALLSVNLLYRREIRYREVAISLLGRCSCPRVQMQMLREVRLALRWIRRQASQSYIAGGSARPRSGLVLARDLPNQRAAEAAAREMNEVADWTGVLKARAEGRNPNCFYEFVRMRRRPGGKNANGRGARGSAICTETIARMEQTAAEKLNRETESNRSDREAIKCLI